MLVKLLVEQRLFGDWDPMSSTWVRPKALICGPADGAVVKNAASARLPASHHETVHCMPGAALGAGLLFARSTALCFFLIRSAAPGPDSPLFCDCACLF